jgi:hypothetical protein
MSIRRVAREVVCTKKMGTGLFLVCTDGLKQEGRIRHYSEPARVIKTWSISQSIVNPGLYDLYGLPGSAVGTAREGMGCWSELAKS